MSINFLMCSKSQETFWTEEYYKALNNYWGKIESLSGSGSSLYQTKNIRQRIKELVNFYHINSIADIPCGDFNWMKAINFGSCQYIGCDIIEPLIEDNIKKYSDSNHFFINLDCRVHALPYAELIICRDLLVHLSIEDIFKALKNFKKSGAKYLLTTTFSNIRLSTNSEIQSGGWRTLNLLHQPFNFPAPLMIINEECSEQDGAYKDKSLALWKIADLPVD